MYISKVKAHPILGVPGDAFAVGHTKSAFFVAAHLTPTKTDFRDSYNSRAAV
jgi:hypothetical protein